MLPPKVLLVSTGVMSAAVVLSLSAPAVSAVLRSEVPRAYGALLVWLTPPYLYFVVNGIIISIAASSRFQKPEAEEEGTEAVTAAPAVKAPADIRLEDPSPSVLFEVGDGPVEEGVAGQAGLLLIGEGDGGGKSDAGRGELVADSTVADLGDAEDEEFVISRSNWRPEMRNSWKVAVSPDIDLAHDVKPAVSARVGGRRAVKASPEGKGLGVAKPKKYETLESTWKTITDGRPMPLARHLKKSDTWGADGPRALEDVPPLKTPVRKSETFNDRRRVASPSPAGSGGGGGSGWLRREPSPGQDELNRRVEAFIKKFNEEMRLQRQESLQRYMDMVNRGSH